MCAETTVCIELPKALAGMSETRMNQSKRRLLLPHLYWPIDGDEITDGDSLNMACSVWSIVCARSPGMPQTFHVDSRIKRCRALGGEVVRT